MEVLQRGDATAGDRLPLMAICLFTRFAPSVGGIETLAQILAGEWTRSGHAVEVVTDVAADSDVDAVWPFSVHRRPGWRRLLQIARRSDVLVHMNVSLKSLWPAALSRARLVASHQSWYCTRSARDSRREAFKRWAARQWALNISCSAAVRSALECGGEVIPNPYDHGRFRDLRLKRDRDIVFVGRLVSDKGGDVLIRALSRLAESRRRPTTTILGDGPERPKLERLVQRLGLTAHVEFWGACGHDRLPAILNRHEILVVPSRWDEPFGIVALEGAACGCVVVGSAGGGLAEAIGPCGPTFPNGDESALAVALAELLDDHERMVRYRQAAAAHLARHRSDVIANRYLAAFRAAISGPAPKGAA